MCKKIEANNELLQVFIFEKAIIQVLSDATFRFQNVQITKTTYHVIDKRQYYDISIFTKYTFQLGKYVSHFHNIH